MVYRVLFLSTGQGGCDYSIGTMAVHPESAPDFIRVHAPFTYSFGTRAYEWSRRELRALMRKYGVRILRRGNPRLAAQLREDPGIASEPTSRQFLDFGPGVLVYVIWEYEGDLIKDILLHVREKIDFVVDTLEIQM